MSITIKSLGLDSSREKEELFLLSDGGDDKVVVRQMRGGSVGWACLCGYKCTTSQEQYSSLLGEGFKKVEHHDLKLKNTPKKGGEIERFLAGVQGEANTTLSAYLSRKKEATRLEGAVGDLRRKIEEAQAELAKNIMEEEEVRQRLGVEPEVKETWLRDLLK